MMELTISRLPAGRVPVFFMEPVLIIHPLYSVFLDRGNYPVTKSGKGIVWGWYCRAQMDLFNAQLFTPPC